MSSTRRLGWWRLAGAVLIAAACVWTRSALRAQAPEDLPGRDSLLESLLDANVRDGYVYYAALKADRSKLARFVDGLQNVSLDGASREEQIVFWINAYNALVLQTIVEHYPIQQHSAAYPARSIRQIPGAFERLPHRVAGRALTLDQIEQTVLPGFQDPRIFLALGRGAAGSGRLRSEAYAAGRLEEQLAEAAAECASRASCFDIDRGGDRLRVSSIFSWHREEFASVYADRATPVFAARSPIERAVVTLIAPRLLETEREFLARNTFKMEYIPFDWTLNDLTGRRRS